MILLGVLTPDPESTSLSLNLPPGQYWFVARDTNGEYRALEMTENGNFKGDVHHMLEDDVLESYMPDMPFYEMYVADAFNTLSRLLLQNKKTNDFPEEAHVLLAALLALVRDSSFDGKQEIVPGPEIEILRQIFREVSSTSPNFEFVYSLVSAAIKHRKNHNFDQAIFYYMKAMDIGGEDANILFNLARVYHELGALERAKNSLERALALDPSMKMARQYLSYLTTTKKSGDV